MTSVILSKDEIVGTFDRSSWQRKVYGEFDAVLASTNRVFPCIFGVSGHATKQLRFLFRERLGPEDIAKALAEFLPAARSFGPLTSLVAFEAPDRIDTIEGYHSRFWSLLRDVAELDEQAWPPGISTDVSDGSWEFCFAGEPIFVVCNTPAHIARQSRRSSAFMLTFQPRWVFDDILGDGPSARRATGTVRSRLQSFDFAPPSPVLGLYGDPQNREALQYFLSDDETPMKCPFSQLRTE